MGFQAHHLPYAAIADLELLQHVLAQDERAWQELLRRFRGLIHRCIAKVFCKYESVLSNEDGAEVFGEVCLQLLRDDMKKLRSYDPARGSKLSSWIGMISINAAYDHLRAVARQPLLDRIDGTFERQDSRPTPLEELLHKERCTRLNAMALEFSPRDRTFVELYFGQGLQPSEVARRMHVSVKTIYSKKNKIRSRLMELARLDHVEMLAA